MRQSTGCPLTLRKQTWCTRPSAYSTPTRVSYPCLGPSPSGYTAFLRNELGAGKSRRNGKSFLPLIMHPTRHPLQTSPSNFQTKLLIGNIGNMGSLMRPNSTIPYGPGNLSLSTVECLPPPLNPRNRLASVCLGSAGNAKNLAETPRWVIPGRTCSRLRWTARFRRL